MKFRLDHININVTDLAKTLAFYDKALGLKELRRVEAPDGSFILVFIGNEESSTRIELTWLRDKEGRYELGDNETHIAFKVDNYEEAYEHHRQMGCICYENKSMGIYFIEDPDGYWVEIIPLNR